MALGLHVFLFFCFVTPRNENFLTFYGQFNLAGLATGPFFNNICLCCKQFDCPSENSSARFWECKLNPSQIQTKLILNVEFE